MGFFPLYRDNALTGPSYVSLSIPPIPSAILKSIDMEGKSSFIVPNIEYIKKVVNGDLGIADTALKNTIFKNINSPKAISDLAVLKKFSQVSGMKLANNDLDLSEFDFSKYKKGDVFRIPKNDIKPPEMLMGFKSLEMTTLKSIFETQKPYIDIINIVLDSLGSVEDIVARVMPLASSNPLRHKSKKPIANGGSGKRPKAIGFGGGKEMKTALNDLKNITSDKKNQSNNTNSDKPKIDTGIKGDNVVDTNISSNSETNYDDPVVRELSKNYKIIDVKYSTGIFIPKIDYEYSYVQLPPDPEIPNNKLENDPVEDDPYDKWKPKNLIFGIFDSNGLPVNPSEALKTSGYSGNNKTELTTPFKRVDWLIDNPKWKFASGEWVWPSLGEPNYVFTNGIFNRVSKTKPENSDLMPAWRLKKYEEGDKNLINKEDAMPGDPVIDSFDVNDKSVFQRYFKEYTELSFRDKDLTSQDKKDATKTITENLEIESHLENLSKYGQNKVSVYNGSFPDALKKTLVPHKIYVPESKADPKLADQNGMIWIDPEADYDMKIIKVVPVTKLKNKSDLNSESKIKTYIKNVITLSLSNNSNFNIDLYKNSTLEESLLNVDKYILENWNIEKNKISNDNEFSVSIWSETPIRKYKNTTYDRWYDIEKLFYTNISKKGNNWYYKNENPTSLNIDGYKKLSDDRTYVYVKNGMIQRWYYLYKEDLSIEKSGTFKLPELAENKKIILDINSENISTSSEKMPLYQFKVENNGYVVSDPYKLNNKFLNVGELYSKESYENGTKENPQKLEILERYQLTDLDTETYYIIEGSKIEDKVDDKSKKSINGDDSGSWYRLPHAVGAFVPFIKLLVKIFSKLIPTINKFISLLTDPAKFITDIIADKLSESFSFLSKETFDTFKNLSDKIKNRDSIINDKGGSFFIDSLTKSFNQILKELTFVNKFGIKKSSNISNTSSLSNLNTPNLNTSSLSNLKNKTEKSADRLKDLWDKRPPIIKNNENFGDLAFLLDGKATLPFRILGNEFNFGMELKMMNLLNQQSPLKLIFDYTKKNKKQTNKSGVDPKKTDGVSPTKGNVTGGGLIPPIKSKNLDPKQYEVVSIWYSTGEYIEGVDYEYSYITIEEQQLLEEIDDLIETEQIDNLELAKDKLNNQILENNNNGLKTSAPVKNKLNIVNNLLEKLNGEIQPIIKLILSLVTTPLTIIGDIVKWIMDFFKSLTNPVKLPGKIAEFLSFSWIMDFFTPKGIMNIMGIKFKPELLANWISIASTNKLPKDKLTNSNINNKQFSKVGDIGSNLTSNVGGSNLTSNVSGSNLTSNVGGSNLTSNPNIQNNVGGSNLTSNPNIQNNVGGSNLTSNVSGSNLTSNVSGSNLTSNVSGSNLTSNVGGSNLTSNVGGSNLTSNVSNFDSNTSSKIGEFGSNTSSKIDDMLPDDYELADLSKFFSAPFMGKLPTYTLGNFKQKIKVGNSLFAMEMVMPSLCFIEKIINGFIDFVWSIMGIEPLIKPPHIKLCPETTKPEDIQKILDGELPAVDKKDNVTQINSTDPYNETVETTSYVYVVKMANGETKEFLDRISLDQFIEENKNINFEFDF